MHDMLRTTDGKSTSRMMRNEGVDAIICVLSEAMITNQETNEEHRAEEDANTSGSSEAGEDADTSDSSDSDDSFSSMMTAFFEKKRLNKKCYMKPQGEWFSGALFACATGMRRGLMCGQFT